MEIMTAERIKKIRADKGWTQEQLAHELGVGSYRVTAWENNRYAPDKDLQKRLEDIASGNNGENKSMIKKLTRQVAYLTIENRKLKQELEELKNANKR